MAVVLDRRCFISGAVSALGSFALPGAALPPGKPRIVFGVISDTHLRRDMKRETPAASFPTSYLRDALAYFRKNDVDAVVHCGDFAHWGFVSEMRFHADVWYDVFPNDKGDGGRHVEKLFVTGNHDWIGSTHAGNIGNRLYRDPKVRKERVFAPFKERHWQEIWHEPYERLWHKSVKGYHFFGTHYEGHYNGAGERIAKESERLGLHGKNPFFVLQHGMLDGEMKDVLRAYPNAVSFFGHWHQSMASDGVITYDGFPMIQCASLRNSAPMPVPGFKVPGKHDHREDIRHGMLVRVYDDRVVLSRRDFFHGGSLGPDWVMPLGVCEGLNPLSPEGLAQTSGAPAFASGAEIKAVLAKDALKMQIPAANAQPNARAYIYDIAIKGEEDQPKWRSCVYAAGCDFAADHALARGATKVSVPVKDLPQGKKLLVAVRPISSLGVRGTPLAVRVSV